MTAKTVVKRLSPMLATDHMERTISFYREVLGFTPIVESPQYSIVERDGQTVHFQRAASEDVMRSMREHTEFYLEVSGIHALWEHVKKFKGDYRIRDLFDREYGMTEFHIADPNGCLVFVGEPTRKAGV
ncbi:MAG TPA: VOC family protein [Verrucomicrobiae bacterium]|nr:VOC family protein [Verrucomicrobiae bacterium]